MYEELEALAKRLIRVQRRNGSMSIGIEPDCIMEIVPKDEDSTLWQNGRLVGYIKEGAITWLDGN